MKFVCERCQTKYSIADEKVRQKVLKIRCKTCENVITIRDAVVVSEPAGPRVDPPPAPVVVGARAVEWHLAINGNQSGPFGLAALVTRVLGADRNEEIYVWNEHLDGWKEPKLIPEVAAEMRVRAAAMEPPSVPSHRRSPTSGGASGGGGLQQHAPGRNVSVPVARGGRSSAAVAAVETPAFEGEGEKTQISALDASLMMDPALAATRPQPMLAKASGGAKNFVATPIGRSESEGDKVTTASPALPLTTNGKGGRKPSAATGLESLDFSPSFRAPSQAVDVPAAIAEAKPAAGPGNGVPVAVVGGSTSMLLSKVGAKASRPRHPAVKYVVIAGLLAGLVGVMIYVSMTSGDKAKHEVKSVPIAPLPKEDPEALARAEAEKYFKSMVGESGPATGPVTKTVGPAGGARRAPAPKAKAAAPDLTPPSLAPPPVTGTAGAPGGDPSRVTQRFAPDERKVAVPKKEKARSGDFDMGKFIAVFKQPDHYAAIKSCYERALKRDDNLKLARLDINVLVGETGSAKDVRVDAPPEFSAVSSCIRTAVRRWRFPPDGKEYEAAFPLILQGKTD